MKVLKRGWALFLAVCMMVLSINDIVYASGTALYEMFDENAVEEDVLAAQSTTAVMASSSGLNDAVKDKILSLKSKYPEGVNWDPNGKGWNNLAWECYGFTITLAGAIFKDYPTNAHIRSTSNGKVVEGWTCYHVNSSNYDSLVVEPGDIIDCPTGSTWNHTAMVLSVDNGKITCVQANNGGTNLVYWTQCFNYNKNNSTLKSIYTKFSTYIDGSKASKYMRLWKPSEELKIQATGYSETPAESTLAISGATTPGEVNRGSSWTCTGTINSNYTINQVSGYILEEDNSTVAYSKTVNPNAKSYSLAGGEVDKALLFNELLAGTYYYRITAKDSSGKTLTLVNERFTVVANCEFSKLLLFTTSVSYSQMTVDVHIMMIDESGVNSFLLQPSWQEESVSVEAVQIPTNTYTIYDGTYSFDISEEGTYSVAASAVCGGGLVHELGEESTTYTDCWFVQDDNSPQIGDVIRTSAIPIFVSARDIHGIHSINFDINSIDNEEYEEHLCASPNYYYNTSDEKYGKGYIYDGEVQLNLPKEGFYCIAVSAQCPTTGKEHTLAVEMFEYKLPIMSFVVDGSTTPIEVKYKGGATDIPKAPEKAGLVFKGWYTEKDGKGTEFTADTEVTEDITVYAYYEHICEGVLVEPKEPTCTEVGNILHYKCLCGTCYMDSACTEQITDKNSVIIAAKGHNWQDATCTIPETCIWCNSIRGSALGHEYAVIPTYVDHQIHSYNCIRNCGSGKVEKHVDTSFSKICDICNGSTVDPSKAGLRVILQDPNAEYVYTGSAIKPAIIVTYDGEILAAGVDYTVKYSNNTNASLNKAEKNKPRITITGKGNLTGKSYTTFEIKPKDIAADDVLGGDLIIAMNTKVIPVLTYNSYKLTNKDYTLENAQKKYTEDSMVKIVGNGNFTGSRTIPVKVVQKEELNKFIVSVESEKLVYNGKEQKPSVVVSDAKTKATLKENTDYVVVYPANITDAGTVKFSVIGMGAYTGTVTKSYTITPLEVRSGMSFSGVKAEGYPYDMKGATIGDDLVVTYNDGTSKITLKEEKDYKITYSNNKKVSTTKASAKFKVSFIGNYRGSAALKGTFSIYASGLSDATPGLKIAVADKIYTGKAGSYKSVPYVSINGVALKTSDYVVTYYKDAAMTQEIKGKFNNIILNEGEAYATVYVKLVGKGNYAPKVGTDSCATASYKVCSKTNLIDLSTAKVTFVDSLGNKLSKVEYTGRAVQPEVKVEVKVGKQYVEVPSDQYKVVYVNNVKKGKATAIITGTGTKYVGSRSAKFTIASKNIKDVKDFWKHLFN